MVIAMSIARRLNCKRIVFNRIADPNKASKIASDNTPLSMLYILSNRTDRTGLAIWIDTALNGSLVIPRKHIEMLGLVQESSTPQRSKRPNPDNKHSDRD
jgi:hypothetical protein